MNKTITVNIGGYAFTIEEEAYNSLVSYLKTIESYFANEESGEEILQDIESRIAELFNERLADGRQVVEPADVDEIKTIMGEPEQYINDEEAETAGSTSEETKEPKSKNRKFYRDVDEAMIGGVCAGLSHYLGWDPIWLRGICIVLTLAGLAAVPVYIILWILIPSANTTAEKLKMKGRNINVENISKSVKDEMEGLKNSIKDIGDKAGQEGRRIRQKAVPKVMDSLGSVAKAFLKFFKVLFGIILLIMGFFLVIGLIGGLVTFNSNLPVGETISYSYLKDYIFLNGNILGMATTSVFLLTIIPMVGIIYMGIRLLSRVKPQGKGIGLVLFGLFFVGVILATITGISQGTKYAVDADVQDIYELEQDSGLIHVEIMNDPYFTNRVELRETSNPELMTKDGDRIVYGFPRLYIEPTNQETAQLKVMKRAHGGNYSEALEIAEDITFEFVYKNDTLRVAPYFTGADKYKYRDHELKAVLYVPDSTRIKIAPDIARVVSNSTRYNGLSILDMAGHEVVVAEDKINCLDCDI